MSLSNKSIIESLLYVSSNDGITVADIKKVINIPSDEIKALLKQMKANYDANPDCGLTLKQYGEKYSLLTKEENHEMISKIFDIKVKNPLTQSLLETLAIIAYNQPCPSSKIESIRGHNAALLIDKLIQLGLIENIGRADTPGRPYLYQITQKFFDTFGIKSLNELPNVDLSALNDEIDQSLDFFDSNTNNQKK